MDNAFPSSNISNNMDKNSEDDDNKGQNDKVSEEFEVSQDEELQILLKRANVALANSEKSLKVYVVPDKKQNKVSSRDGQSKKQPASQSPVNSLSDYYDDNTKEEKTENKRFMGRNSDLLARSGFFLEQFQQASTGQDKARPSTERQNGGNEGQSTGNQRPLDDSMGRADKEKSSITKSSIKLPSFDTLIASSPSQKQVEGKGVGNAETTKNSKSKSKQASESSKCRQDPLVPSVSPSNFMYLQNDKEMEQEEKKSKKGEPASGKDDSLRQKKTRYSLKTSYVASQLTGNREEEEKENTKENTISFIAPTKNYNKLLSHSHEIGRSMEKQRIKELEQLAGLERLYIHPADLRHEIGNRLEMCRSQMNKIWARSESIHLLLQLLRQQRQSTSKKEKKQSTLDETELKAVAMAERIVKEVEYKLDQILDNIWVTGS